MKKSLSILVAVATLQSPLLVYAQNAPPVVPIVGGKGGAFIGNAGDYNIKQELTDNSKVASEIIANTHELQQKDKDYLLGMVEGLNTLLRELIGLRRSFVAVSQKSSLGDVKIEEYLTLANDISAKTEIISAELKTKSLINRETLPSYDPVQAGNMQAKINRLGQIDMTKVTVQIEEQLNELLANINSTQFPNLITPLGQRVSIASESLNTQKHLKGIRILTAEQISQFTDIIRLKRTPDEKTVKYQQQSVDLSVSLMKDLAHKYGRQEWLRFTNDNDGKALKESMVGILDSFYRRSYLRKKFGIRMGAIQTIQYKKVLANLEDFKMQPLLMAMGNFRGQGAVSQEEINSAFENARNFLELYDKKVTPVFAARNEILQKKSGLDYVSLNTNALIRMNSAVTYLTGQRKTAEIMRDLMILVLSDILEEKKLVENDQIGMAALHDTKYRSSAELKKQANIRICQIDFSLSKDAHENQCLALGVKVKATQPMNAGGRSVGEIFANLILQYNNVERGKMQEARFKQELIDAALLAAQTDEEREAAEQVEEDIFD